MSKQLEQLDYCDMFEMIKTFRISLEGITDLDGFRIKLRQYLEESSTRKTDETHQVISEAGKLDTKKRKRLQTLYIKTAEFLKQLEPGIIQTLEKSWGDLKTTLEERMTQVSPREQYVVLVAGETSAGKSSVINLILGEDLLPSALLSTTSTICELKYGDNPAIRIHFKENGSQKQPIITRELVDSGKETYQQQIDNFVNLREGRDKTPYRKIELFFPHPLLKEKVMIVDSPGIGESKVMSEFVLNYLPRAFCFMYVINSENAGGVQEDRLGMLLNSAKENLTPATEALFTGCTLFVCNKWDRVRPSEEEEVKKEQIAKLEKRLVNLDPKSQIVYLSCTTAQKAQTCGYITTDFNNLITGISNLLVSSMQNNLQMHYRWLEDLLFHVSRQIKISLKTTRLNHEDTEKKIKRVLARMKELKISQQRKFDQLSEFQSKKIQEILEKLVVHFRSEDTEKRFCDWSAYLEAPQAKETWQETKREVLKCISERTQRFIQLWEDDEHEFAKAQKSIFNYCSEKYFIMEEEIRKVEEGLFSEDDEEEDPKDEDIAPSKSFSPAKSRKQCKETAPVWLRQGLASVVVGSPLGPFGLAKMKKKLHCKPKLQRYKDDPYEYLSNRSRKSLKVIATQDKLLPFINQQLQDSVEFLNTIKVKIPKLLESDEQLYQNLLEVKDRTKTQMQEIYQPLEIRVEFLTRDLTNYHLTEMRKSDFTEHVLKFDGHMDSIIGSGTFSTVYKGALTRQGEPTVDVALKVFKDPVTTSNVWHFVDEEKTLKALDHPGIVKYFGTNLREDPRGTIPVIVLELCKSSLKTVVMSQGEDAPANPRDDAARKKVLGWALQILDTLRYIHSQGYVHRDLKLDNLLLAHDGRVKLADVGVAKHERDITGTVCGTSLYLAPEVFEGRIYNSKADMYSFGFVLWELWYGKTAFEDMVVKKSPSALVLLEQVRGGLRPAHIEGAFPDPWGDWKDVMESCWKEDPRSRLKATEAWECFQQLQKVVMNHKKNPPPVPPKRLGSSKPRPRSNALELSTMPKTSPRPRLNTAESSARFCAETQEASVQFQSKENE